MASFFKSVKTTVTSLLSVVQTTAEVVDITMDSAKDLALSMNHTTKAYQLEIEIFKQKRINILEQYSKGTIDYSTAMDQIQELNTLIEKFSEDQDKTVEE